jgi:hypothetical protein
LGRQQTVDRLINGDVYNAIFPVHELRALDTTRTYAARSTNPYAPEERAEKLPTSAFALT